MRLRKNAVKKRIIGGIERHREVLLRKAGLGSVRLAYFIVFTQLRATVEGSVRTG